MTDNGCRDHCPCVGKTWGTIIDTHRANVAQARLEAAAAERERLRERHRVGMRSVAREIPNPERSYMDIYVSALLADEGAP